MLACFDRFRPGGGSGAGNRRRIITMSFAVFVDGSANLPKQMLDGIQLLPCDYTVDGVRRVNHYLYGEPPFRLADYRKWIRKAKIPGLD